jgi:hypothetical protein
MGPTLHGIILQSSLSGLHTLTNTDYKNNPWIVSHNSRYGSGSGKKKIYTAASYSVGLRFSATNIITYEIFVSAPAL